MIVRVSTEAQYEVSDAARLNELDNAAVKAVEGGDESAFRSAFDELLTYVRSGRRVADDELSSSDVILPPPDVTLAEAAREFNGEGLIPG